MGTQATIRVIGLEPDAVGTIPQGVTLVGCNASDRRNGCVKGLYGIRPAARNEGENKTSSESEDTTVEHDVLSESVCEVQTAYDGEQGAR